MPLDAGIRLGPYEIGLPIGTGGMGEVYRARDTKLDREVAIKVLPADLAADRDRVARFEREAKLLAALNHPNIAGIHGFEESDGVRALVLELVEGPTLAERVALGRLSIDEAKVAARQIAEALEAGHAAGIVHRDLKPANIKLRDDGTVKVLDYGLAKAFVGDVRSGGDSELSDSPTRTQGTQVGSILGTAAYMSPEQARGKPVDQRTDVWAFGAVVYEMLTGKRLFAAETVSDTIAAVLREEIDWSELPRETARPVREVLRRCLERNPERRLHHMADARIVLEEQDWASTDEGVEPSLHTPKVTRSVGGWLPWTLAALGALAVLVTLVVRPTPSGAPREPTYLDIPFPPGVEAVLALSQGFALAPDGRGLALIGARDGVRRVYVHRLDHDDVTEVPATEGANLIAFSPDGDKLAIIPGSSSIVSISLVDLQRTTIGSGADITGGLTWCKEGIVYSRGGGLWLAPLDGREARPLTEPDAGRREVLHTDSMCVSGGEAVLFTSHTAEEGTERIELVRMDGSARSVLIERATTPIWSGSGYLLFNRDGAVLAAPFDPERLSLDGPAVPVIPPGVVTRIANGGIGLSLSPNGSLAYIPSGFGAARVVSVRRDGSARNVDLPIDDYGNPRISPDGRRLLVSVQNRIVEMLDLERGTRERLLAAANATSYPTWGPEGRRIVARRLNLPVWMATDGTGDQGAIPSTSTLDYPSAPGPEPDSFLSVRVRPETSGDVFVISLDGSFEPRPLVGTKAYEGGPQMSPDGRWLLYQSDESGNPEIYVSQYPTLGRRFQVSAGRGVQARFGPAGDEIFYRDGESFVAVSFDGAPEEPVIGPPEALFADEYEYGYGISIANYEVARDGRLFLLRSDTRSQNIRLVLDWDIELMRIIGEGGAR